MSDYYEVYPNFDNFPHKDVPESLFRDLYAFVCTDYGKLPTHDLLRKRNQCLEVAQEINDYLTGIRSNEFSYDVDAHIYSIQTLIRILNSKILELKAKHCFHWSYDELEDMDYQEFLKTDYWRDVREAVLSIHGNKCVLCSSVSKLYVHHKTYEHRGHEHNHLEDLTVLCESCHKRHHNK